MDFKEERIRLENGSDRRYDGSIYKNEKETLKRNSEQAEDEKEVKEADQSMKKERTYLEEDTIIYKSDTPHEYHLYFDHSKEASHRFYCKEEHVKMCLFFTFIKKST